MKSFDELVGLKPYLEDVNEGITLQKIKRKHSRSSISGLLMDISSKQDKKTYHLNKQMPVQI